MTSGSWRSKVGNWFSALPWTIGHLSFGLVVYLIPNMKHLELFIALSALPFMFLWFLLPESPRWLLSKGKNEEAIKERKPSAILRQQSYKPDDKLKELLNDGFETSRGVLWLGIGTFFWF